MSKRRHSGLNRTQQKLVDNIIKSLEENKVPWQKPWDESLNSQPRNAATGTTYKGANQISLTIASWTRGFTDPRWCTYNQAKENGWQVKAGAKGETIYYALQYSHMLGRFLTAEDYQRLNDQQIEALKADSDIRLKHFSVFNAEEIAGIPKLTKQQKEGVKFSNEIATDVSRNIFDGMAIKVRYGEPQAFYSPDLDVIGMPDKQSFKSEAYYYGTLFHELSHATGHSTRLNRDLSGRFGNASYSEEELVAQFSSIFLSQNLGFKDNIEFENNVSYIKNWLEVIKGNPKVITNAIKNANSSYQYLYEVGKIKDYEHQLKEVEIKKESEIKIDHEVLKRDVLITDYARNVLGLNLVTAGRNKMSTKEHDSMIIFEDRNDFVRFSQVDEKTRRTVGGNIFNFVMHFHEVDYKTAVEMVNHYYLENEPDAQNELPKYKKRNQNIKSIDLPEKAKNNDQAISYLVKDRHIAISVVDRFIKDGLLYQDNNNNCVFLGKLEDAVLYASRRGANKDSEFKQDVANSVSEMGVFVDNKSDVLILTEGVIDAMSIMSMKADPNGYDYLSVNGVGKAVGVTRFHLQRRMQERSYGHIIVAFDNDAPGEDAAVKVVEFLKEEHPEIKLLHSYPKSIDWNDDLVNLSKKHDGLSNDFHLNKNADILGMG